MNVIPMKNEESQEVRDIPGEKNQLNNIDSRAAFIKNPLGLIGLFLVIVESIAALVIPISTLEAAQETILIWFIVLFPLGVLFVFYSFVTAHHEKLYAPSDFADPAAFITIWREDRQDYVKVKCTEENKELIAQCWKGQLRREVVEELPDIPRGLIEDGTDFMLLIKYPLIVNGSLSDASVLKFLFGRKGLVSKVYTEKITRHIKGNEKYEAIWLGSEVPMEVVKKGFEVLLENPEDVPEFKYIYLSEDIKNAPKYVHNEIYFGGASSKSKEYRLVPMRKEDFSKITKFTEIEKLHEFIRSFYER